MYTRWDSYCDPEKKIALIRSLANRAKRICSEEYIGSELAELKNIFHRNGYPPSIVDRVIHQALAEKDCVLTVKRKQVYLRLPWLGAVSASFRNRVRQATAKVAPWCEPIIHFGSRRMLTTSNKDILPTVQTSNVIYLFSCDCERSYVGRTSVRLCERARQHIPTSLLDAPNNGKQPHEEKITAETKGHRRSKRIATSSQAQKKEHKDPLELKKSDSGITRHLKTSPPCLEAIRARPLDRFSVLAKARNSSHLGVLEAMFIRTLKPELCAQKDFVRSLVLFK